MRRQGQAVSAARDEKPSHRTPLYPAENLPTGSASPCVAIESTAPQDRRRRGCGRPSVISLLRIWNGKVEQLGVDDLGIGSTTRAGVERVEAGDVFFVSVKSKMSMFSTMRPGRTDLGIAERPCSTCQRRTICAGVFACTSLPARRRCDARAGIAPPFNMQPRTPSHRRGSHDCVAMPSRMNVAKLPLNEKRMQFHLVH